MKVIDLYVTIHIKGRVIFANVEFIYTKASRLMREIMLPEVLSEFRQPILHLDLAIIGHTKTMMMMMMMRLLCND